MNEPTFGFYARLGKPAFDCFLALVLSVFAIPIFVFLCLLLLVLNKGSVFFIQQRPGLHGKPFGLLKFRTFRELRDAEGNLLPDKEQLSPLRLFLRRTSLDELPQLLNVLLGQMSLVGPRPLLMEYLPLYDEKQSQRHLVKPGITGWAQVNGRNTISWQQKFDYDVWYVHHLSFALDIRILAITVLKVLAGKDVSSTGHLTSERFEGNR